jgi:hypothetical protein
VQNLFAVHPIRILVAERGRGPLDVGQSLQSCFEPFAKGRHASSLARYRPPRRY